MNILMLEIKCWIWQTNWFNFHFIFTIHNIHGFKNVFDNRFCWFIRDFFRSIPRTNSFIMPEETTNPSNQRFFIIDFPFF